MLVNAEKAVLLHGTHLATVIAPTCNTWAQGAFWQLTLPLSVVSHCLCWQGDEGIIMGLDKTHGPPRSSSLIRPYTLPKTSS